MSSDSHSHHGACCSGHNKHPHLDPHELGHVVPFKIYVAVCVALLILTVITVVAANIQFSPPVLNIVVAMGIASIKALLVAMFFMHLKYENPLTWLYAAFPIFLLAILIGGIFLDNSTRNTGSNPHLFLQSAAPAAGHAEEHKAH